MSGQTGFGCGGGRTRIAGYAYPAPIPGLERRHTVSYDRSLALFDRARKLMPGGSQTTSKRPVAFAYGAYPIYVDRSEGSRVTDVDGNTFIDLVSALGPIVLGYSYPAVNQAVAEQLERGIISGLLFPVEVEAAELVTELVPSAEMVRFFKGGGESTAAAARIARLPAVKPVSAGLAVISIRRFAPIISVISPHSLPVR